MSRADGKSPPALRLSLSVATRQPVNPSTPRGSSSGPPPLGLAMVRSRRFADGGLVLPGRTRRRRLATYGRISAWRARAGGHPDHGAFSRGWWRRALALAVLAGAIPRRELLGAVADPRRPPGSPGRSWSARPPEMGNTWRRSRAFSRPPGLSRGRDVARRVRVDPRCGGDRLRAERCRARSHSSPRTRPIPAEDQVADDRGHAISRRYLAAQAARRLSGGDGGGRRALRALLSDHRGPAPAARSRLASFCSPWAPLAAAISCHRNGWRPALRVSSWPPRGPSPVARGAAGAARARLRGGAALKPRA